MKAKLLIISLLICLNSFGQKLPITNLCLSDIVAVTGGTCLSDAFTNADPTYFDATYATSGNCLSEFRNYGPPTATVPTVTTASVGYINPNTAFSGGNVTADGGSSVTARGICWNTSTNPTFSNSHTSDGTGVGSFISGLTGLTASTLYYVRAYATNSTGTGYGSNVSFTTASTCTTRPSGLTAYYFSNVRNGVAVTAGNICTIADGSGGTGLDVQTAGFSDLVYFGSGTNCDLINDGYYIMYPQYGGNIIARVRVLNGVLINACP